MSTIEIGRGFILRDGAGPALDTSFAEDFSITPRLAVATTLARGAGSREVHVPHDAVAELELEGGVRLWLSGERLHELLEPVETRGDPDVLLPQLRLASPVRGPGRWALRALRLFDVALPAELVAGVAADAVAARVIERLGRASGRGSIAAPRRWRSGRSGSRRRSSWRRRRLCCCCCTAPHPALPAVSAGWRRRTEAGTGSGCCRATVATCWRSSIARSRKVRLPMRSRSRDCCRPARGCTCSRIRAADWWRAR